MARSYGRFTTSIYKDDDFRALTLEQQGAYFMLGLQAEVSAAGTLSLTLRRWSRNAAGQTQDSLNDILIQVQKLEHILIDEDTEELLIVKFVKWDGGYGNSKRLPVVRDAALAIESPILRRALAIEMRKLGLSDVASELDPDTASDSASDAVSPSDRVVVKKGESIPHPYSTTLEREPPQAASGIPLDAGVDPPSMFCPKHPEGTTESCGPCGTARKQFERWHEAQAERAERERADARRAIRECIRCNRQGFIEDRGGQLLGRCDHQRSSA